MKIAPTDAGGFQAILERRAVELGIIRESHIPVLSV
jgi:hypothetical protein